ncbi:MAG: family 4C encapsulin nanocompartment shell protein [Bacteroidota bacterium]
MTVLESSPSPDEILPTIDASVRALQESGLEPRFIVVGPSAYGSLCGAIAKQFGREPGRFEQYQWLTIVVDPFRAGEVAVLPAPRDVADGVRTERLDPA